MNKQGVLESDSALDIALDQNQIRSVNMMIDYIVKYQNNYVYQDLFISNFVEMAKKGVTMTKLVKSKIFNYTFDFDQWPGTNANTERLLVPYNDSIFKIRHHYQNLFPELHAADE